MRVLNGIDQLDKVIDIDQSPIGRTPRSNPATYTGVFDNDTGSVCIDCGRKGEKVIKKEGSGFNVKGGRCEACGGDGIIKITDAFLSGCLCALRGMTAASATTGRRWM